MRVTYLVPRWDIFAGAERAARALAGWLAARGHHVVVLAGQAGRPRPDPSAVQVRRVERADREAVQATTPDVVLAQQDWLVPLLTAGVQVPVVALVHTIHDAVSVLDLGLGGRVALWCFNSAYTYRLAVAAAEERGTVLSPSVVCPPGFDPREWVPGRGTMLGVVNHSKGKGGWRLLTIAKNLPDEGFLAVSGAWGSQVRDDALTNIRWVASQDDMRPVYAKMKALLVLSGEETFGLSGVEAQASGCAVFASDIPALRESLGDGAVYLPARAGDMEWVRELRRFRKARAEQLRDAALRNAARYDVDRDYGVLESTAEMVVRYGKLLRPESAPAVEDVPDFCVVIPSYNRPDDLNKLLLDIEREAQRGDYRVHVKVYDDASPLNYRAIRPVRDRNEWAYKRVKQRHGKERFWSWVTYIYNDQRGQLARYFLFLPDDVRLCADFFGRVLAAWDGISDDRKLALNLLVDKGRVASPCWTGVSPERVGEVDRTQWVDGLLLCERRYLEALDFEVQPIHRQWSRFPGAASGVGEQISKRLHAGGWGMYRTKDSLVAHIVARSQMNPAVRLREPQTAQRFVDGARAHLDLLVREPVTASLASIPAREAALRRVVASLRPQVHQVNVYLNGYSRVPDFLLEDWIKVARSQEHGDNGDAGKFYWAEQVRGFHLTCDDDLEYPPDYAETLVSYIEHHGRRGVYGFHGVLLSARLETYYGSRTVLPCLRTVEKDQPVHILGTGALGYHTDAVRVRPTDFRLPNMADVWFGILGQDQGVPFYCIHHQEGWLRLVPGSNDHGTIYEAEKGADERQTTAVREAAPWSVNLLAQT